MADTDTVSSLADLKDLTVAAPAATVSDSVNEAPRAPSAPPMPLREREVDAQGRSYATGRERRGCPRVD